MNKLKADRFIGGLAMLHFANAQWAGRVQVINGVIFMCKTGDFLYFAKVGPVQWKLGWAGRVVVGNCLALFSVPVRPWIGYSMQILIFSTCKHTMGRIQPALSITCKIVHCIHYIKVIIGNSNRYRKL